MESISLIPRSFVGRKTVHGNEAVDPFAIDHLGFTLCRLSLLVQCKTAVLDEKSGETKEVGGAEF